MPKKRATRQPKRPKKIGLRKKAKGKKTTQKNKRGPVKKVGKDFQLISADGCQPKYFEGNG